MRETRGEGRVRRASFLASPDHVIDQSSYLPWFFFSLLLTIDHSIIGGVTSSSGPSESLLSHMQGKSHMQNVPKAVGVRVSSTNAMVDVATMTYISYTTARS